ncbi:MAG TPA: RES family NAD+ phosphorylase [Gemmatimonadaceae bacterium]|nr:RES family NAD+ phosphorylase [Gemmatimonadaceae bacterium]
MDDLIARIFEDPPRYKITVTSSFFTLKNSQFRPWQLNESSSGRFSDIGTGSLYLGDTLGTCLIEVGSEGRLGYQVDTNALSLEWIFNLRQWSRDNPADSGSLLVESGSGGWEPTLRISRRAREEGFQGVLYESRFGAEFTNLVVWGDKTKVIPDAFTEVDVPGDSDERATT